MLDPHQKPQFDPRSPVQDGHNVAPYFLLAVIAAVLIWTLEQNWGDEAGPQDSASSSRTDAAPAAEQSSPSRGDVRTLFSSDDYPAEALDKGEQGTAQAKLTVDADGRVERCDIIRSSGHESLDKATCAVLKRRARFTAATGSDGAAIPSEYVTPPVTWRLENG